MRPKPKTILMAWVAASVCAGIAGMALALAGIDSQILGVALGVPAGTIGALVVLGRAGTNKESGGA